MIHTFPIIAGFWRIIRRRAAISAIFLVLLSSCSRSDLNPGPPPITRTQPPLGYYTETPVAETTPSPEISPTLIPTQKPAITVTTAPAAPTATGAVLYPPSGWIAYISFSDYPNTVELIKTNGQGRRIITDDIGFPNSVTWSPDGRWIAVHGYMENNRPDQIFIMHPDGTGFRQLTFSTGYKQFKSWASDSNSIIYSELVKNGSEESRHDYYEVDIRTGASKRYTGDIFLADYLDWEYSPQGNLVAYIQKGAIANQYYIWIMDRDGSNPRQLIDTPVDPFGWSWAPDGTQLVVSLPTGIEKGGSTCTDFYLVSVDGESLQQLTDSGDKSEHDISWSPGGEWIAFTQTNGCLYGVIGEQVYLIRTDGSGLTKLPNVPRRSALSPDWSPLPGLELGKTFTMTESGAGLRLRYEPTTQSKELTRLDGGDQIRILDGPVEADEYLWWRVRVESSGLEGWVVELPGWFVGE